ncbi:PAS domain S-box protein [Synechocystis salina LEGE 06155]|nr:PAS domain S-box protein [Synechocystis salina LEGE 06155]
MKLSELKQQCQKENDPFIMTDNQGIVVEVNGSFEKIFGWKDAEIKGEHVTIVLPVTFRDSHHLGFSRFAATEISTILNHPLELKALTKSGQEILSEHFIVAEKQNNQWYFAARLRPL